MATKIITREQAEQRFHKKLSDEQYGHKLSIEWTGEVRSGWGRTVAGQTDRDVFNIQCDKCSSVSGASVLSNWRNPNVNADGSIPQGEISAANYHFLLSQPDSLVDHEAEKVLDVHMKRGGNTEFWVVHYKDDDFWESIEEWGERYRGTATYPFYAIMKNSRGSWRGWGVFGTRDEAVGMCTKQVRKYQLKGYQVDTLDHTSSGHVPPSATIKVSVKKLINDYKELSANATPIEQKAWLDKVDDALTQMQLLEALYGEVKANFTDSLLL